MLASHQGGFSRGGAQALGTRASVVAAHELGSCVAQGLVAPRHVGSSQTRDQTRVCYTGRQILIHCTTRKVPGIIFYMMRLDEIREGGKPDRAEVWGSSCGLYQCLEFWDLRKNQQKKLRNQLGRQEESPKRVTWRTRERELTVGFTKVKVTRDLVMHRWVMWIVGIKPCWRKIPAQWEDINLRQDSTYNYFSAFFVAVAKGNRKTRQ